MKKSIIVLIVLLLIIIPYSVINFSKLTGNIAMGGPPGEEMGGPSAEQVTCMQSCVSIGCDANDMTCKTANSQKCGQQCGVDTSGPPAPADEGEACMQECVVKGCNEFDFTCERNNRVQCEDECNMKGDAPDESEMSEEQLCITRCVASVDPTIRCGNSQEGETGGAVCQKCANDCVHLYAGPCLNDEQKTEKEKECKTCEHCYGETVMGPSGEGWDCIVDVECKDSSGEFGDEPGEGSGISEEGFVAKTGETIGNVFEGIGNFFKNLFGGGESQLSK